MTQKSFTTPILFIVFNRPEVTAAVFEEIRKIRPTRLYVTGDGPRPHKEGEAELCRKARAVATAVDWPCEVKTLFREENLGCKYAVGGALDWFFNDVEEGIVLEDDDLPDPSFFPFCAELLEKYRDDERVMHISGNNFQQHNAAYACAESYYFSRIPHIWGWASWRRAWKHYDIEVRRWPEVRDRGFLKSVLDGAQVFRWGWLFEHYYRGTINSYDTQWAFACLINSGLAITPRTNLVSNIGFGPGATHTSDAHHPQANVPLVGVAFPLVHPEIVLPDPAAEAFSQKYIFYVNRYWSDRARWFFKSKLGAWYVQLKYYAHLLVGGTQVEIELEKKLLR